MGTTGVHSADGGAAVAAGRVRCGVRYRGAAVERVDESRIRLDLRPDPAVAARVADLLVRETDCCSFFTFTLTATDGTLLLEVAVPPAHVEVLDAIADGVAAGRGA